MAWSIGEKAFAAVVVVVSLMVVGAAIVGTFVLGVAHSKPTGNMGYAVGGAQDANAFRNNVNEGYLPAESGVTYDGLFHEYYFDRGQERPCSKPFCPSFGRAVILKDINT